MDNATIQIETCDVLVVGGGPAGIAAACVADSAGAKVILVDDNSIAGGQIWRTRRRHPQAGLAGEWLGRLAGCGIQKLFGWRIVAMPEPRLFLAESRNGVRFLQCRKLILATGARERFLPFPGWTLPGVVGAGAMQALTKSGLNVRGKRVLLAGSGPLLLAVAAHLKHAGAQVPFIAEQASAANLRRFAIKLAGRPGKLLQAVGLWRRIRPLRLYPDSWPLRVEQADNGLRVVMRVGGNDNIQEVDYLACGFGLVPNCELAALVGCDILPEGFVRVKADQSTSIDWIYAAGELTGIGGVDKSLAEGQVAARTAVGQPIDATLRKEQITARRFAGMLAKTFALRPQVRNLAQADTIVCRCEDISLGAVNNRRDARDIKLQTRCGMGPCQGRICGPILQMLALPHEMPVRPPIQPCRLETLAAEACGAAEKSD